MPNSDVSKETVNERVRNRLIEYLELVQDVEALQRYQERVGFVEVSREIVNQFEDWMPYGEVLREHYGAPTYSDEEFVALQNYHRAWSRFCDETPPDLSHLSELLKTEAFARRRRAAETTLRVFLVRGKGDDQL